jgi:hypothetical protein
VNNVVTEPSDSGLEGFRKRDEKCQMLKYTQQGQGLEQEHERLISWAQAASQPLQGY